MGEKTLLSNPSAGPLGAGGGLNTAPNDVELVRRSGVSPIRGRPSSPNHAVVPLWRRCFEAVCGLTAIHLVFFGAGAGAVVLGVIARQWRVVHIGLCAGCDHLADAAIVMGSLLVAFSLLGIYVTSRRAPLLLLSYLIVLCLLSTGVLGLTAAVVVLDYRGYQMDAEWQALVARGDVATVCSVQDKHSCSGWAACCGSPDGGGGSNSSSSEAGCEWNPLECLAACPSPDTAQGCGDAMRASLRIEVIPFTVVVATSLVLMCVGAVSLFKVRKTPREESYLELEH